MNMKKRKTLIVGNWKMHLNVAQSSLLLSRLQKHIAGHRDIEVVIAPSTLALQPLSLQIDRRRLRLAAQNANAKDEGALTGEVSFAMLHNLVHYVIIGHSERRIYFNESLEEIRDKVAAGVRNEIMPILCVGETAHERGAGETKQVLHDQVTSALSNLTAEEIKRVVIAYEPVWAIGKGIPAKPHQINQAMSFIRHDVRELYGAEAANTVRLIYGASVEPEFVSSILSVEDVDGLLPGSASLNYHKFSEIVDAAYRYNRKET